MYSIKNHFRKFDATITAALLLTSIFASMMAVKPVFGTAEWWNTDWQFRKPITINYSKVAGDLINFPVLIDMVDDDLAAKAQIDGDDIAFADYYGNKLDHEIEFYNGTNGKLIAWVRIPFLSSTEDTTIYMYYGNPEALNQENREGVWDSNYMMVHHFNERYENGECRFWGMIAQDVLPSSVVLDHLINLPNSLKILGATNPDGWGLGYYVNSEVAIRRGQLAANIDPNFDAAAQELASSGGRIGIGHVRKSASPPYNVPNPHPFNRTKLGKTWMFAHHGTIDKAVLVNLIGADYLAANPPQYGNDTSTYNDSELYFIYLLKCVEENGGNVRKGIAQAVTIIAAHSPSYNMNFVLSDGTTLWAFRRGDSIHPVYYYYNPDSPVYSAVASQYPTSNQGSWIALNNYNLVELSRTDPPLIIDDIRGYAPTDHFDSTANKNDGVANGNMTISTEGKINAGDTFDGVDDYISVADDETLDGRGSWAQLTVEFWVKSTKDNQKSTIILSKREKGTTPFNSSYQIGFDSAGNSQLFFGVYLDSGYKEAPYSTSPVLATNQWYHVVGTFNSPSINLYVNGVVISTGSQSGKILSSNNVPLRIGCRGNSGVLERFFAGALDEVRLSNVSRSQEWIKTSFNNQNDPSSFYTIGGEESQTATTIRIEPTVTHVSLGSDCVIHVEIVNVVDLYAWEFQLQYDQTILNLISSSLVLGGLNEPVYIYYNLTDQANGLLWLAASTIHPTTNGVTYAKHAIVEIRFHAIDAGTSNLSLFGTILCESNGDSIPHEVVDGTIIVEEATDLTVTNINVSSYGCSIYANDTYVNGTTYYYPVEVTIQNTGATSATSFYVKLEVYWINGSVTETSVEKYVSTLAAGEALIINFTNVFHPTNVGFYRLIATVDSRNDITESNETNNELTLDNIAVAVMGDVNGDRVVNLLDGVILALAWGASPSDPQWNIKADVNHDGHINILDGVRLGMNWGKTW